MLLTLFRRQASCYASAGKREDFCRWPTDFASEDARPVAADRGHVLAVGAEVHVPDFRGMFAEPCYDLAGFDFPHARSAVKAACYDELPIRAKVNAGH